MLQGTGGLQQAFLDPRSQEGGYPGAALPCVMEVVSRGHLNSSQETRFWSSFMRSIVPLPRLLANLTTRRARRVRHALILFRRPSSVACLLQPASSKGGDVSRPSSDAWVAYVVLPPRSPNLSSKRTSSLWYLHPSRASMSSNLEKDSSAQAVVCGIRFCPKQT